MASLASLGCNAIFGVDGLSFEPNGSAGSVTTTIGTGGTATGGGQGGNGTVGGNGGIGGAGGTTPPLVDRGLVVRYYIDEADQGQAPMALLDAAPNPVDLPITYTNELQFVQTSAGRALEWTTTQSTAVATNIVAGTKVVSALDGSTVATVEVVLHVSTPILDYARFLNLAIPGTLSARLALKIESATTRPAFDFNDAPGGNPDSHAVWEAPLGPAARAVTHVLCDTTQANAAGKLRFFLNGVEAPPASMPVHTIEALAMSSALDLSGANMSLALGNNAQADRPMAGRLHYAAVYNVTLLASEIANNASVLLANDDRP